MLNIKFATYDNDSDGLDRITELVAIQHPSMADEIVVRYVTNFDMTTTIVIERVNDNGSLCLASFDSKDAAGPI